MTRFLPESAEKVSQAVLASEALEVRGSFGYKIGYRIPLEQWDWEWLDIAAEKAGRVHGEAPVGWDPAVWADTMTLAKRLAGKKRPPALAVLSTTNLGGILEFSPEDQTVVVRAGTLLADLQKVLAAKGQCIPLPDPEEWGDALSGGPGTVGGMLSMNLPHGLSAQCGSWRDWILGLEAVLGSGEIVRSGCRVVKNVAGYDAMKLFVGARGSLGIVTEVTLKTFPLAARPQCRAHFSGLLRTRPSWIQRTLPTDFQSAKKGLQEFLVAADEASSTLWASVPRELSPERFPSDWVLCAKRRAENVPISDPAQIRLMKRAKSLLDPAGKLNPGEFGFL